MSKLAPKKQNIRQRELGQRRREMFWLACEIQQQQLSENDPQKWIGININKFLREYSLRNDSGEYATKRYFDLFLGATFETDRTNPKFFKVALEYYNEWLKDPLNYYPF